MRTKVFTILLVFLPTSPTFCDEFDQLRTRIQSLESKVLDLEDRVGRLEKPEPPPELPGVITITPQQSINLAISRVDEGGTVLLLPGLYQEMIKPSRGRFNLEARDPGVVVAPIGEPRCAWFAGREVQDIQVKGIVFDGLGVQHECVKLDWIGPDPSNASQRITFENCEFKNAPVNGVLTVGQSRGHKFVNCEAHDNGSPTNKGHGFYVSSSNVILLGCSAYRNQGWGFHPYVENPQAYGTGRLVQILIKECKGYENGWYGAGLYRGDGNVIEDSFFWKNVRGGIEVGLGAKDSVVRNNKLYLNNGVRFTDEEAKNSTKVINSPILPAIAP